jgi:hypothetical protein
MLSVVCKLCRDILYPMMFEGWSNMQDEGEATKIDTALEILERK